MTTGLRALLAVTVGLALVAPAGAAKKPKLGVFGKINGKKFKAKSNGASDDPCVFGTYDATGKLTMTAGKCAGRPNKAPQKNFAQVLLFCPTFGAAQTPPFERACAAAAYAEATVKNNQASDQKTWLTSVTSQLGEDGIPVVESGVRLRVDAFDGTMVRGAFFGVFDLPQTQGLPAAPIKGEVRFNFPVKPAEQ